MTDDRGTGTIPEHLIPGALLRYGGATGDREVLARHLAVAAVRFRRRSIPEYRRSNIEYLQRNTGRFW